MSRLYLTGRSAGRLVLAAAVLVGVGLAAATPAGEPAATVELWAELPAGARGVATLVAGGELPVTDAGRLSGSWRVVILFDQQLSEPRLLRNGAVLLAERAAELTALGPVEIVLADEEGLRTALPPTAAAPALDEALAWIRVREGSRHLQAERRRDFAARARPTSAAAEAAATAEREEIAAHLDRLLVWAAEAAGGGPQILLYVGDGYEADPAAFYGDALRAATDPTAQLPLLPALPAADELGRALSVLGWTVVAFRPAVRGDTLVEPGPDEESGMKRLERVFEDQKGLGQVAVGIDPRKIGRGGEEAAEQIEVLADPIAPLTAVAEQTGGELVVDPLQLTAAAERLAERRRLRVELGSDTAAPVEVRLADDAGRPVKARRWVGTRLPEQVSAARLRQFLRDELEEGELWVDAAVEEGSAGPELLLQVEAEALTGEPRLTLGAVGPDGEPVVVHQPLGAAGGEAHGDDLVDLRLPLPAAVAAFAELPVAVLIEVGGARGAAFAARRSAAAPAAELRAGLAGTARALRLVAPEAGMLMGPNSFRVLVDEQAVSWVDFFLDGELAAAGVGPPFTARLDLGQLPRTRRVLAVGYGAGGAEVARDSLLVNRGSGMLEVRIASPRPAAGGPAAPLVGAVEVEAEVRVPDGARLDRVEFYWRDRLVATRYAPPFRESVEVAAASPRGFVRVVARLADGTSGEDVVFINSPGPSERLEIDLVELYVVVSDREGRPVKGLPEGRFRLLEDGRAVEIASFGDAGELPLTVGLAIDSSASMFVKLPRVQQAAAAFVRGLEPRRDRAFLVSFGRQPRLARTATRDLPLVVQALDRLRPDGQTAIWEAIAFSLVQLQGVPGKKALIVYSDGADEDPEFSYRTCLRFARTVGAPIYVILSNNEIMRTGGRGLQVRGFLGRLRELTSEVGGRVYLSRVGDDLDAVYREIAEELRSQYFIGYYSPQGDGSAWRRLEVDVKGSGLTARTIAGFFR